MTENRRRPTPEGMPPELPAIVAPLAARRLMLYLLGALVLVSSIAVVALILGYSANQKAGNLEVQRAHISGQAGKLYSQVASRGATPIVTPPGVAPAKVIPGPTGPAGATGPEPSRAELAAAVAAYCAPLNGCAGVPSSAQVLAALRTYCASGVCVGTPGPRGSTGPAGEAGPSGVSVTPDQVSSAVSAYCSAHNGCVGAAGPSGASGANGVDGSNGKNGIGITSLDCTGLGVNHLTVHYTDGTTQDVPCSVATPSPSSGSPTP